MLFLSVGMFKALGEPTRLALFELLARHPHHVNDLVAALALPQPAVSRHLRVLKEAGLVTDHRSGRRVEYRIRRDNPGVPSLLEACAARTGTARGAVGGAAAPDPAAGNRLTGAAAPQAAHGEAEFVVHAPAEPFDSYLL